VKGIIASLDTSEPSGKKPDGTKPPFRVFNLGGVVQLGCRKYDKVRETT
jgi:hypothetical protein